MSSSSQGFPHSAPQQRGISISHPFKLSQSQCKSPSSFGCWVEGRELLCSAPQHPKSTLPALHFEPWGGFSDLLLLPAEPSTGPGASKEALPWGLHTAASSFPLAAGSTHLKEANYLGWAVPSVVGNTLRITRAELERTSEKLRERNLEKRSSTKCSFIAQGLVPVLELQEPKHHLETQNHGTFGLYLFGFATGFVALRSLFVTTETPESA